MRMRDTVKLRNRNCVRLAFIVCLAAVWGCVSGTAWHLMPLPQTASRPPEPANVPPPPSQAAPSSPAARFPAESSVDCGLISELGEPVATVGLEERIDPANAPHPSNESERLLFRQLYETLVRVDCNGRVGPGLAASWRLDANPSTWIVTLRDKARFSDGTLVTAADVVSDWSIGSSGGELRPEVRRLVRSVSALDDRTLEIALRSERGDAPLALAHTDLAIARRVSGSLWPVGTRPVRIVPDGATPASGRSVITLMRLPVDSTPLDRPENLSSVRFIVAPGRDLRDLLDEGIDLLLTRQSPALDYAATLPQFVSTPLEWQRTHVLLIPGRARTSPPLSAEAREALAHDAVRGEARGALGPIWWQSLPGSGCEVAYSQPRGQAPSTTGRIVYDTSDGAARDLAERLVGLVRASGPGAAAILDALLPDRPSRTYQIAAGLTGEALAMARRRGNDAGYIMVFDRRPLDPCREIQAIVDNVGWVDPETIVPLVDTRLQAVVRRGRSGVTREWDGGLLIVDGGR
jgi:Bacterial extracellular solute-binding proteins, family 5 Middle